MKTTKRKNLNKPKTPPEDEFEVNWEYVWKIWKSGKILIKGANGDSQLAQIPKLAIGTKLLSKLERSKNRVWLEHSRQWNSECQIKN